MALVEGPSSESAAIPPAPRVGAADDRVESNGRRRVGRAVVAVVAAGFLVLAFGIASVTGSRPLGGVFLLIGAIACGIAWSRVTTGLRTVGSLIVFGIAFIAAHPLAEWLTAWPAVILAASAAAVGVYLITARPRQG